jgi:hypothetical protein
MLAPMPRPVNKERLAIRRMSVTAVLMLMLLISVVWLMTRQFKATEADKCFALSMTEVDKCLADMRAR